jgi:hypothetical protein
MINKFDKQINTKTWNISGTIKIKVIMNLNDKYKRSREYEYYKEEKDRIVFTGTRDYIEE